ncbi:hypothetical protein IPJ63_02895 [Candidatus Nomurabacteria bacterium]|nr:MAG: hypothetical protein IPJ63_02895 [Candidatus Nomurabacteria bacterium]
MNPYYVGAFRFYEVVIQLLFFFKGSMRCTYCYAKDPVARILKSMQQTTSG